MKLLILFVDYQKIKEMFFGVLLKLGMEKTKIKLRRNKLQLRREK